MHGLLTLNGGTTSSLSCPLDLNLSYSSSNFANFAATYCDTCTSFSAKVFRSILTTVVASSATRKIESAGGSKKDATTDTATTWTLPP